MTDLPKSSWILTRYKEELPFYLCSHMSFISLWNACLSSDLNSLSMDESVCVSACDVSDVECIRSAFTQTMTAYRSKCFLIIFL